jgi:hypothetical protein
MNDNQAVNIERCNSLNAEGFVKLYARGKIGLLFSGDSAYTQVAEECFRQALNVYVSLEAPAFARAMRNRGASESVILKYLISCTLIDEVRLSANLPK